MLPLAVRDGGSIRSLQAFSGASVVSVIRVAIDGAAKTTDD